LNFASETLAALLAGLLTVILAPSFETGSTPLARSWHIPRKSSRIRSSTESERATETQSVPRVRGTPGKYALYFFAWMAPAG
jgi:hypothetical protein